jgi:hypothetical protein
VVPLPRRRPATAVVLTLALGLAALPGPAAAAAPEFPVGWEGYHTYAETVADIAAVEAAHPDIVTRFSIGKSYQGRDIWVVKISDNVAVDENEPEVMYDGAIHSDEHMTHEMMLRTIHWLADGYAGDARIRSIVDSREIWVIPMVNPDGVEYDIAGRKFHYWRKNRQPNAGSAYIGTDLNRNFDYRWGGGGRTSSNPQAITYRGPSAFSAPETRAYADFVRSRYVDGRQQIRAHITFHEAGRLVMWPYGYTMTNLPGDMTRDDFNALVKIGKTMAASNGYRPQQASDLYVTSGTARDWLYGRYRIFSYTFEMSVKDYPDDSMIGPETNRNREAVLYLAERAWCPLSVLGATVMNARCGAYDDDLEVTKGWRVNPDGTDTATAGGWQRGVAQATSYLGARQLTAAPTGQSSFATGLLAGASTSANDLDGGRTTALSPTISLPAATGQRLTFRWSFAHYASATSADELRVEVVADDGTATTVHLVQGAPVDRDGLWTNASISMDPWAGQTIRLRFSATDGAGDGLVEAAFDDVRVTRPS